MKYEAAVTTALNLTWSNGQIIRLKAVKRQVSGRKMIGMLPACMICSS